MGIIRLENNWVSYGFDDVNGQLLSIINKVSGCEFLGTAAGGSPFAVYYDFHASFCFPHKPQSIPYHPVHPRDIASKVFMASGAKASFSRLDDADTKSLTMMYDETGGQLQATITVILRGPAARWTFAGGVYGNGHQMGS